MIVVIVDSHQFHLGQGEIHGMAGQGSAAAVTGFYHQVIQCRQGCRLPDATDGLPSEHVVEEDPFAFCPPVSVLQEDEPVGIFLKHADRYTM